MTVKERIRFNAQGLLEDRITVTDPMALTKPWETVKTYRKAVTGKNDELREFACPEGLADARSQRGAGIVPAAPRLIPALVFVRSRK